MLLPPIRIKRSMGGRRLTRLLLRGAPAERLVNATAVVINPVLFQRSFEVE